MMRIRLLCLALAYLLGSPVHVEAQQTKLRAALQAPLTDPIQGQSFARFKDDVEKRSNKAISFEVFDNGTRYIDDQIVDAVASGTIEIGMAGLNQFVKVIPAIGIVEQPFLFNFEALVRAATSPDSEMRRLIDKAVLDTIGVRVLRWQSVGNQIFVSKGKDVTDPLQIKDRKVRVFSETVAQFVRHCGAHPVTLSTTRLNEAFRKSEIDMATGAGSAVFNRELWTVADTITRTMHAPIEFLLIVNEKTWQALPEAHRAILAEAARTEERLSRENIAELEAKNYTFFRQKGMTIHELSVDDVADWRACSAAVIEDYIHNTAELGRQLMAAYRKLRTDPCCSSSPATGTFNRR